MGATVHGHVFIPTMCYNQFKRACALDGSVAPCLIWAHPCGSSHIVFLRMLIMCRRCILYVVCVRVCPGNAAPVEQGFDARVAVWCVRVRVSLCEICLCGVRAWHVR